MRVMSIFILFLKKPMARSLSSLCLAALLLTGCGAQPAAPSTNINVNTATSSGVVTQPTTPADNVFCTEEYAPVCGKRQVQCIKAPCEPVEQTYSNKCYAQKDGAFDVKEGACAF